MSINRIMLIVFGVIGALSLLTFYFAIKLADVTETELVEAFQTRYFSYQAADELRQSSDDLTRLARTYVVTGNSDYEKMYMDILDIRNGKKSRPENYHTIYWDLVLNYGDKPKPDGKRQSLQDMMVSLGFSEQEFSLLKEAQNNSDTLVGLEVKAMNAVKGLFDDGTGNYSQRGEPDFKLARELLHSQKYHREKAKIMAPIDKFFKELEKRTSMDVNVKVQEVDRLMWFCIVLMLTSITACAVGYYLVTKKISSPINGMSNTMVELSDNNDLSLKLAEQKTAEIKKITDVFNGLIGSYNSTVKKIGTASNQAVQLSENLTSVIRLNSSKCENQNSQLYELSSAMEEMTATLREVSERTNEAEAHAGRTEEYANQCEHIFDQTAHQFEILKKDIESSSLIIDELAKESTNVGSVLNVIKSIAEQTNLLALNAAIEAARAGDQGRGFAVVADEVRSLAKRTQESTIEIEQMIESLQARANSATSAIKGSEGKIEEMGSNISHVNESLKGIEASTAEIHQQNTGIAASTEEQLEVGNKISQSIHSVSDLSKEIADSTEQQQEILSTISENINDLNKSVSGFKV